MVLCSGVRIYFSVKNVPFWSVFQHCVLALEQEDEVALSQCDLARIAIETSEGPRDNSRSFSAGKRAVVPLYMVYVHCDYKCMLVE